MNVRGLAGQLTPPILARAYRIIRSWEWNGPVQEGIHLSGDYSSWAEAMSASTGYENEVILEKTRAALLKVKSGEAAYERDSVLFDQIQYAWPLLAGLMWVAACSGGRLNVLDFGGSLGSTYFQNRRFLEHLPSVRWNIVEQPRQVEVGKADFEDGQLRFYYDIKACMAENEPNVTILSGVLQYLEQPFELLSALLSYPCSHLIIDRTPFWDGVENRLCVQYVPASIYAGSYPSWVFSEHRFRSFLNEGWDFVAEFEDPDRLPGPVALSYRGMLAVRRKHLGNPREGPQSHSEENA